MVFVRMLSKLLRDKEIGNLVVPIVPDEARTFGMESLFRAVGIYSHVGQLYEPVDMDTLLYYKEAKDGQILEEGITEAGSMSSFIAAGTAYATHGVNTIPFFIYYSMFGFQRVGDLIWAARRLALPRLPARRHGRPDDARGRRAAAPGRPQPRLLAVGADLPRLRPGVRLRAGGHHPGRHPADVRRAGERLLLPDRDERAVRDAGDARGRARRHPQGPVPLQAAAPTPRRSSRRSCSAAARSSTRSSRRRSCSRSTASPPTSGASTSYNELYRDAHALRALEPAAPDRDAARAVRHRSACKDTPGVVVAASDYLKSPAGHRSRWMPRRVRTLGTDGFGRSEDRARCATSSKSTRASSPLATLAELAPGRADRREGRRAGVQGPRNRSREDESGDCADGGSSVHGSDSDVADAD